MDRLTRYLVSGAPDCAYCTGEYMTKRGCSNRCELRKRQISRLTEYEDTGLTPKEVSLLSNQEDELSIILEQYKLLGNYGRLCKLVEADRDGRVAVLPFRIGSYVNPESGGKGQKIDAITIYEDGRFGLCFHEHGIREEYYDEWSEGDSSEYFSIAPPDKQNS